MIKKEAATSSESTSTGFLTSCSQRLLSLEGCESLRRLVNNDKDPRRKFCLLFSLSGTLSWDSRYAEPLDGDWWSVGQVCHLDIRGMTLGPASLTIGTCTSPPRLKPLLYNITSNFFEISFILTLLFLSLEDIIMDQVGYNRGVNNSAHQSSRNMGVYIQYLCT